MAEATLQTDDKPQGSIFRLDEVVIRWQSTVIDIMTLESSGTFCRIRSARLWYHACDHGPPSGYLRGPSLRLLY